LIDSVVALINNIFDKKKNADVNFLLLAYLVEEPETFYLNYQEKDKCALIIRFYLNKQESDNIKKALCRKVLKEKKYQQK